MTRLILMRHAKSSWDDMSLDDHDRPLNKRGQHSAVAMGAWLRARAYIPTEVISSTSKRTRETLEGLGLDAPVRLVEALYHAPPRTTMELLRTATSPCVLMLGHNPGFATFAAEIVSEKPSHPRFHDYPTCATLVADLPNEIWADTSWGSAQPVDFAIPREVVAT